jgi:L-methionine (R)-S-oxide reductase
MNFNDLEKQMIGLVDGEKNFIANLANVSSLIFHTMPDLNWCGFYLWDEQDQELVLGPFQGKPACLRIKPERGVCGAAYTRGEAVLVEDVHAFPGHIACDAASESELVVPLKKNGKTLGVLDIDSPKLARFTEEHKIGFTRLMETLSRFC